MQLALQGQLKWQDSGHRRRAVSKAWLSFLSLPLPPSLLHQVIVRYIKCWNPLDACLASQWPLLRHLRRSGYTRASCTCGWG